MQKPWTNSIASLFLKLLLHSEVKRDTKPNQTKNHIYQKKGIWQQNDMQVIADNKITKLRKRHGIQR
jgi:hypothetical protein